jgi:hypothetical protein
MRDQEKAREERYNIVFTERAHRYQCELLLRTIDCLSRAYTALSCILYNLMSKFKGIFFPAALTD